jgi:hypothetical protein
MLDTLTVSGAEKSAVFDALGFTIRQSVAKLPRFGLPGPFLGWRRAGIVILAPVVRLHKMPTNWRAA